MTTRTTSPKGAPCWVDLWTSDVDASRRFYSELFGWEAAEPSEEFGGYFMFLRGGAPVAGGMGPMADLGADNRWKPYFSVSDATETVVRAEGAGGKATFAPSPVADLGTQSVLLDPSGIPFGIWQPGTFEGFSTLEEDSAPSWFELQTPSFQGARSFYESCLGWTTEVVSDTDEFRYFAVLGREGEGYVAGVGELSGDSAHTGPMQDTEPRWYVYWEVDDVAASVAAATRLGATVAFPAQDTPYGTLAWLVDTTGAPFNLRRSPQR